MLSRSSKLNLPFFSFSDLEGNGEVSDKYVRRAGIDSKDLEYAAPALFASGSLDSDASNCCSEVLSGQASSDISRFGLQMSNSINTFIWSK